MTIKTHAPRFAPILGALAVVALAGRDENGLALRVV
jgi:hypothetical protein